MAIGTSGRRTCSSGNDINKHDDFVVVNNDNPSRYSWTWTLLFAFCLFVIDVTYVIKSKKEEVLVQDMHRDYETVSSFPRRRLLQQQTSDNKNKVVFEFDKSDPHLELFQLSDYTVLGPTQFPKPTRCIQQSLQSQLTNNLKFPPQVEVEPILKPTLGTHRSDKDAVFVFASEYDLSIYQGFILSLRKTGYKGDIVLAISPLDMPASITGEEIAEEQNSIAKSKTARRQQQLYEFFSSDPNVIIYVVPFVCFNAEGQEVDSAKGGIRTCQCNVLYGQRNVTTANKIKHIEAAITDWVPLSDFRSARPVATTRYELYWIWSIQYEKHTWQMLVDARDTYFQLDPFASVPREPNNERDSGVIFFFGENSDATRIGKSDKNRKWLTNAYGVKVIEAMEDKPTICSGATMGEQIALETYLRAMVNEYDETNVQLMGADQGFHNYLYYSGKLQNAKRIRSISVFDQGRGIVNNMGAMRTKEINEWGNGNMVQENGDEKTVLNWDGKPSPVVHQFDRFKTLSTYVYKKKTRELQKEWEENQKKNAASATTKQ